jgi:hypothetical protein
MIRPTLNINGSSADDLIDPRIAAYEALQVVKEALAKVTPNGRDYPGDTAQCVADREAHYDRLATLRAIAAELILEVISIEGQTK